MCECRVLLGAEEGVIGNCEPPDMVPGCLGALCKSELLALLTSDLSLQHKSPMAFFLGFSLVCTPAFFVCDQFPSFL